jgi:hypothetical protein
MAEYRLHGETAQRLAQCFHDFLGARRARGVHRQPALRKIEPRMGAAATGECPRAQLVGHPGLEVAHLATADRIALLRGEFCRPFFGLLVDHRSRQQLPIHTEREQMMPALRIQQPFFVATGDKTTRLHVETTAGLQRTAIECLFEFCCGNGPVFRQAIENQVLEQHGSVIHSCGAREYSP